MNDQRFSDEVTGWQEQPPHWQGWYDTRNVDAPIRGQRRWYGVIEGRLTWSQSVRLGDNPAVTEVMRLSAAPLADLVDLEWRGLVNQAVLPYPLQRAILRREAD